MQQEEGTWVETETLIKKEGRSGEIDITNSSSTSELLIINNSSPFHSLDFP